MAKKIATQATSGGNISIFAHDDASIGIGRIFTLRGGSSEEERDGKEE